MIGRKTRIIGVVVGILTVGVTTTVYVLMAQPLSAPSSSNTTANVSTPLVSANDVQIALPGAQTIGAIHENYDAASSLWTVVSKTHALADSFYTPQELGIPPVATNTTKSTEEQSLRSIVFEPTKALFTAAKSAGYDVIVASGYRSYALQKTYFDNYSKVSGEEAANKYSARPGQSEHQTGLAFDISLASRECYLETCFGDTTAGEWLALHAYEYGFVLRYPAEKTAVTQYQYEPWHFRYVGTDLAKALHDSKMTLDEAYPYLQTALKELKEKKLIEE